MIRGYLLRADHIASLKEKSEKVLWQIGAQKNEICQGEENITQYSPFNVITGVLHRVEMGDGSLFFSKDESNRDGSLTFTKLKELPQKICCNSKYGGVEELQLKFNLKRGKYTFTIDILESEKSNYCIASFDGEEIAAFGVPYVGDIDEDNRFKELLPIWLEIDKAELKSLKDRYGIKQRYEKLKKRLRVFRFDIPFICAEAGEHILSLTNKSSKLNDEVYLFKGEGFYPVCFTMTEGFEEVSGWTKAEIPGKSLVDLWGWMSETNFDHPGNEVTPPERLFRRSIQESFKWGANNFEFLPVNRDGMALDLSKEEEWKGKDNYLQTKDTVWSCEEVEKIIKTAHEYGMLAEFFLFTLHGAEFLRNKMQYDEKINLYEKIVKNYANVMNSSDIINNVDGIITEAWFPIDSPQYTEGSWKWNPGFFLLASIHSGEQIDIVNAGYSPSTHHYVAHWPTFSVQHTGFDHCYPLLPYPKEFYEKPEGTIYTYMQGCGQTGHLRKNYPRIVPDLPLGITNRNSGHDWIIAQSHNFALRRLTDPSDRLATAMCWEADEETMVPKEARRYVYAVSQDPVRLAAAATLSDTGQGGEIDLKKNTRRVHKEDTTKLRKRHKLPASSTFIQNRFLQTVFLADRDYSILQMDMQGTATFYNNGALTQIAFPFCITRFEDDRFLEKEIKIIEPAGVKSVIEEYSTMGSGYVEFKQKSRYTVYSDIPAIFTKIERTMEPGFSDTITTFLGFTDYDISQEILHPQGGKLPLVAMKDSTGVLPEVVVEIKVSNVLKSKVHFEKGKGLFIEQLLQSTHYVEIITFIITEEVKTLNYSEIITLTKGIEMEESFEEDTILIKNNENYPAVKCLKVLNPDEAPYYVNENGWWIFKGATPSLEEPGVDYLKLYMKPNSSARVQRYGYIEGVLRPGWGCQNLLAFKDIIKQGNSTSFTVNVDGVTPMISAPRVEFLENMCSAVVNGEVWTYFDGKYLMLPNIKGTYTITVLYGEKHCPQLLNTYAAVRCCEFKDNLLKISFQHPQWVNEESGSIYRAVIDLGGFKLMNISGAIVKDICGSRVNVEFVPGDVVMEVGKLES
jgi:hypothetical protein